MEQKDAAHIVKDSWNYWSDTWYSKYRTEEAISNLIDSPESAFHPTTYAMIKSVMPCLQGKRVCAF
ncbi:methyltransferase type 11 [Paenibacillus alvei TS-15]|jgi:hypothetical protein|uniref:Methyltransferase type 11 n=1 Tax=Paenibacillus alvei TS-15 TaxID=1117108 RepID=S9SVS6_PAEAL|nr:hypothetical protein [Paenibacillus alvei]EPY08774.1 methyltransferase type 11 [Paenibacillus alvei TS-15]